MRRVLWMETMEPRMLLSADALAVAGLPGFDVAADDAPWDLLPSDLDTLAEDNADGEAIRTPKPLTFDLFSALDVPFGPG